MSIINKILKRDTKPIMPSASQLYHYKNRFAMMGTVGSGKSTVTAGLVLTAMTLSSDLPDFYCRVIESNSDILADASNLRRGRFPHKTEAYERYPVESGLLLIWKTWRGTRQIQIPICDIAGEDIQQMIKQSRLRLGNEQFNANQQLLKYVKDADGFLICVPASRALMFLDDEQIEHEESVEEGTVGDPDVPLSRILNDIINFKTEHKGKSINAIGVIITKWDLLAPYAVRAGMDIYDSTGEGLNNFMKTCFPGTLMHLKPYLDADQVKFFPSHFNVKRHEDGKVEKWGDTGDRIDVIQERRVPRYSEQSYVNLFKWLRSFAT